MLKVENEIGRDIEVVLREMYTEKLLSTTQISNELGISVASAKQWCKRFGIELRSNSEAKKIQHEKTPLEIRKKHTAKANEAFRRKRDEGTLVFNRPWMVTDDNPAKHPESRRKNSEFHKKHNPMFNEKSASKMRRSMERYLRTKATPQELIFKKSIEKLGYYPKFQHAAARAILDFAFTDLKIGIEIDGESHLRFDSVREKDIRRDSELEGEGWIILRFFNCEIEDDLGLCLREVIELVEANRRIYAKQDKEVATC